MIKKLVPVLALLLAANVGYANQEIIKSCSTTIASFEEGQPPVDSNIEILSDGNIISARITQHGHSYIDLVVVKE